MAFMVDDSDPDATKTCFIHEWLSLIIELMKYNLNKKVSEV